MRQGASFILALVDGSGIEGQSPIFTNATLLRLRNIFFIYS
jgi:hypothetical protein